MPIQEGAGVPPPQQQAFTQWNDPQGTKLIALNRDGTIFCEGIILDTGAGINFSNGTSVPLVQAKLDAVNTQVTHSLSLVAPRTSMYTVSVYLESEGDGLNTDTLVGTLMFSEDDPTDTHSFIFSVAGGPGENITMETYPIMVEAGTTISFATSFSAGVITHDVGIRIVEMP